MGCYSVNGNTLTSITWMHMWLEQIQIWTGHLDLQCKSSNATRTRWKSMDGEASPLLIWIDWLNLWAADSFQTTLAPPLTALADWTALVRLIFRVHTFCLRAGRNRTQHLSAWLASTFLTRRHLEKNKLAQWEGDHKYTQWKHAFLINSLTIATWQNYIQEKKMHLLCWNRTAFWGNDFVWYGL